MKTLFIGISSPIGQSFLKAASKRGLDLIAISEPSYDSSPTHYFSGQIIKCDLGNQKNSKSCSFKNGQMF